MILTGKTGNMYRDPTIQKWLEDPGFIALPNPVKEQKINNYLNAKKEGEISPKQKTPPSSSPSVNIEDLDAGKPYFKYLSTPKEVFSYEAPAEEYERYPAPGVEAVEREPETGKLITHKTLNLLKKEGEEDFLWYTPDEGQKTEPVLPTMQNIEKFEKDLNIAKAQQDPLFIQLKDDVREKKIQNYFLKHIVDDDFWKLSEDKRTEIAINFFNTNLPLPAPERSPIEELVTGVRVASLAMQSNFHSWKALHAENVEDKIENYIKAAEIHEKLSDRKYALQSPDVFEVRTFRDALNWGIGTLPQVASSMGSIIASGLVGSQIGALAGSVFFPGVGTGFGGTIGFLTGSYVGGHQLYAADIFFSLVSQGVPFEDAKRYAEQYSHGASAASLMVPGALYMGIKGHFGKQWMKGRLNAALKTVPITTPAEGVAEFIAQQFVMNAQEKALGIEIPSEQRWREGINAAAAGGLMGFVSGMTGGAFLKRGTRAQMVDGFLTEMDQLATHPDVLSEAISQLEKVPNPNKDTQSLIKYLRNQHEGVSNRSLDRQEKLIGQKVAEVTGREPGENIKRAQHLLTKGDLTTEEALELSAIYANNPIYRISQKSKLGYPLTPEEIQFGMEKGILSEENAITPPSPPTTDVQPSKPLSTAEQLRAISEAESQQDFLPDVTIKEVNKKKFAEIDRLKKIKERSPEEQKALDFLRQTKDLNRIADFFENRLTEPDAPLSQQGREELEHRAAINNIDTKGLSDEQVRQAIINAEDKGAEPKFMRITEGTSEFTYSEMEKQLEVPGVLPKMMSKDKAINIVENLVKKGKFKKAELTDSGLIQYIESFDKDQITKEDVINFLQMHSIQLNEVVYIEENAEMFLTNEKYTRLKDLIKEVLPPDQYNRDIDFIVQTTPTEVWLDAIREGEISVPLDLLFSKTSEGVWIENVTGEFVNEADVLEIDKNIPRIQIPLELQKDLQKRIDPRIRGESRHQMYQAEGKKTDYREILFTLPLSMDQIRSKDKPWKKDIHFEDDNVLVYLRVSDRVTKDGKKVFVIEELQSDWLQTGQKYGFTKTEYDAIRKSLEEQIEEARKKVDSMKREFFIKNPYTEASFVKSLIEFGFSVELPFSGKVQGEPASNFVQNNFRPLFLQLKTFLDQNNAPVSNMNIEKITHRILSARNIGTTASTFDDANIIRFYLTEDPGLTMKLLGLEEDFRLQPSTLEGFITRDITEETLQKMGLDNNDVLALKNLAAGKPFYPINTFQSYILREVIKPVIFPDGLIRLENKEKIGYWVNKKSDLENKYYSHKNFHVDHLPTTQPPMKSVDSWSMLPIKRAIYEATKDGYDYVAWVDGETHKKRWGQQGLVKFYDDILKSNVDKYIGRWSSEKKGSRVKRVPIEMGVIRPHYYEHSDHFAVDDPFTGREIATFRLNELAQVEAFIEDYVKDQGGSGAFWGFPITESMAGKHPKYIKRITKKPKTPAQISLVEKTLNEVKEAYPALKNIKVAQKESELPQGIQQGLKKKGLQGKVYGVAYGDTIYVIANNITSEQASDFTVIDSIVRHEGRHILFQKILGGIKAANEFFTKASIVLKTDVQNYLNEHRLKDTLENRREAAEEILADMAKRGKIHNLIDQLLSKLLEWLRKIPQFKNVSLTQAELRKLVADADAAMATGFNEIQESDSYIYSPRFMRFVGTSVAEQLGEKSSLNNALKLKKEGKTTREIWKKTGWFEISENDWYLYLPDKPLDFTTKFLNHIYSSAPTEEILRSIARGTYKEGSYNTLIRIDDAIKDVDSYKVMKLYPFLKDLSIKVKYVPPPEHANKVTVEGAFHVFNNTLTLYLPEASWMKKIGVEYRDTRFLNAIRNTLSHELQHGIQHEEKRQSNFPGYIGVKSTGTSVSKIEDFLKKDPKDFEKKYTIYRDKINSDMRGTLSRIPMDVMKQFFPKASVEARSDISFRISNAHLIPEAKNLSNDALEYQRTIKRDLDTLQNMDQGKDWWSIFQERIEGQLLVKMDEDITSGRGLRSEEEYVGEIIDSFAYPIYAQTTGEVISRTSGAIEEILIKNPEKDLTNIYPGDLISKDVFDSEGLIVRASKGKAIQGKAVSKKALYQNMDEALEGTLIPGDIFPELDLVLNEGRTKVEATSLMENKNDRGMPIPPDYESPIIGANESMKHGEFKTGWIKTVFSSVSDVFRDIKEPWADDFANKVDNYYNALEQRLGEVNAPFHEVMKTIYKPLAFGGKGKDVYFKDFSEYFRHMDWGRIELAERIYKEALPETRTLIDQAKKTFDELGDKNLAVRTPEGKPLMVRVNDMYVWDQEGQQWLEREKANHIISELKEKTIYKGGWRPIRKIKKGIYFPRKMRSEIVRLKANPELDPGLYETVIDALENMKDSKGNLRFSERAAAEKWFKSTAFNEIYLNDYHANIEKSRRDPLPEIFYDYSWATASDYFYAWAKRVAQVETYGQDVAGRGDYFDRTLSKISDGDVRNYAIMVRDAIYEAKTVDKTTKYVGTANMIATASQLANIATATRNLIGGTALNVVSMGPGRTIKALGELISDYREIMAEGVRLGILGKDIMNLFNDNDSRDYHTKYAKFNDRVSRFASWSMSRSLYKYTENIIRATAMISAKNYLTESLHNINKNGMKNKKAIQFIAWTKRHNLDSTKLILEDGVGKETAKMLRKSVNIPQGSYRIDMTPMFVDTKWGRFLFKYQKFSTQVSRLFYMEYFKPLMDSIKNPQYNGHAAHEMARTIGFVATGIFGGTLDAMIRMYVFGYMDKGPDPDDLLYQISQDKEASLKVAWLLDRAMNSLVNSGFLGVASTPIQGVTNLVNQRAVANPLDPPGVAVVTHLGQFLSKLVQTKGDMGYRDVVNSADQLWAMFRAYRRAGLTTLEAVGLEWQEVQYHSARKEQMYVRKVISRWMRDSGYEIRRPQFEGVYRTPQSKFNQQVYEAIATGRPERARIMIREYLKGKPKSERDAITRSLAQSVRNRQPMTFGGTQNDKLEKEFRKWLNQDNLPDHSKAKILRVQKEYLSNAKRAGVL